MVPSPSAGMSELCRSKLSLDGFDHREENSHCVVCMAASECRSSYFFLTEEVVSTIMGGEGTVQRSGVKAGIHSREGVSAVK